MKMFAEKRTRALGWLLLTAGMAALTSPVEAADRKLIIIAGKASHPPLMHEYRAGSLLLQKCLAGVKGLSVQVHTNGWVTDDKLLETADAVFFYSDGGPHHPVVFDNRLELLRKQVERGLGIGCAHYAVEVPPNQGGSEYKAWFAGEFEHQFSVNTTFEPHFKNLPKHPVANGVKPFSIRDESFYNLRYSEDNIGIVPILVARQKQGPDMTAQGEKGRDEVMMWVVERKDGGRGLGFTGGHFHKNWGNDDQRKLVLNALLWLAKVEVPKDGVQSTVTEEELMQNLDDKPDPRKQPALPPKAAAKQ